MSARNRCDSVSGSTPWLLTEDDWISGYMLDGDWGEVSYGLPIISFPHEPLVTPNKGKRRAKWGTGWDARSQDTYRHYDLETSKVMNCLRQRCGSANNWMLRKLMDDVVKMSSRRMTISAPGRHEKRSKRGLAQWLDRHWDLVMIVLNGHRQLH
jgi:hypothetical protein